MSPRGRWSLVAGIDILTHISTGTRLLHIYRVRNYALLMHTQTMSESNENRETPITCITTCSICTLHGINRHNTSTIVCKCSDNLFQTNVYIKCNLDRSHTHTHACTHARTHARARTHTYTRQETWREVALGGKNTISRLRLERRVAGR